MKQVAFIVFLVESTCCDVLFAAPLKRVFLFPHHDIPCRPLQVPKVLTEALDNAGMEVGDVDWLLLHQVFRNYHPLCLPTVTMKVTSSERRASLSCSIASPFTERREHASMLVVQVVGI